MKPNEIIDIINDINEQIINSFSNDWGGNDKVGCYPRVSYTSDGIIECIKFEDIIIWDSENDTRIYYDEKDEYEPLETCLKRQIKEIIKTYKQIKIK